jgi:hypothetical protein
VAYVAESIGMSVGTVTMSHFAKKCANAFDPSRRPPPPKSPSGVGSDPFADHRHNRRRGFRGGREKRYAGAHRSARWRSALLVIGSEPKKRHQDPKLSALGDERNRLWDVRLHSTIEIR